MKIKRLIIVFIIGFIVALGIINYKVILDNLKFASSNIEKNISSKTSLTTQQYPEISPRTFPNTEELASDLKLPSEATLNIPKIGVSVPIVFDVENTPDDIFAKLKNGVVRHPITPKPGEPGLSMILGHSSSVPWDNNKYGTVFSLLGKLNPGDIFTVKYSDGRTYTYVMRESIIFNPFDQNDPKLIEIETSKQNGIVAITCWPVGTAQKRLAVRADLI